jgi:hypothetical protein
MWNPVLQPSLSGRPIVSCRLGGRARTGLFQIDVKGCSALLCEPRQFRLARAEPVVARVGV